MDSDGSRSEAGRREVTAVPGPLGITTITQSGEAAEAERGLLTETQNKRLTRASNTETRCRNWYLGKRHGEVSGV